MSAKVRISVSLDRVSHELVAALAEREKLGRAEIVCKALGRYLRPVQPVENVTPRAKPDVNFTEAEMAAESKEIADRRSRRWR